MISRSFGAIVVMAFLLQSGVQAQAACQTVNGAVCGGAGKGSISSVSGNVSLAQGGGISRASVGASVSAGARVLAGDSGAAQVNLGAGCFTSVTPNSIATVTSQNGLTCMHENEPFTAQAPGASSTDLIAGVTPGVVGAVVTLGVIGGGVAAGIVSSSSSLSP